MSTTSSNVGELYTSRMMKKEKSMKKYGKPKPKPRPRPKPKKY